MPTYRRSSICVTAVMFGQRCRLITTSTAAARVPHYLRCLDQLHCTETAESKGRRNVLPVWSKLDERQVRSHSSNTTGVAWWAGLMTVSVAVAAAGVTSVQRVWNTTPSAADGWATCMCTRAKGCMDKALMTDWLHSAAVHMAENNRPCIMHTPAVLACSFSWKKCVLYSKLCSICT